MSHEDLRKAASESIAAYMHHRLSDAVPQLHDARSLPFLKSQAESLMDGCDRAVEKVVEIAKEQSGGAANG
jgi:hypothetical protein